jgi:CubicO group peptidase (beta-lactamase class C family)
MRMTRWNGANALHEEGTEEAFSIQGTIQTFLPERHLRGFLAINNLADDIFLTPHRMAGHKAPAIPVLAITSSDSRATSSRRSRKWYGFLFSFVIHPPIYSKEIFVSHHRRLILMICITALLAACAPAPRTSRAPSAPDYWPTSAWKTSPPAQQGMDAAKLAEMLAYARQNALNLRSVLVIRNGYIVMEGYADPYTPDTRHTVESNTKSIVGALIGIAIRQGKIPNTQTPMLDFFPNRLVQNDNSQKRSIQLRHLLTMSSGLDCADLSDPGRAMYAKGNWTAYLMDLPVVSEPGQKFAYCSGGVHILSAILQSVTGSTTREYANQQLFQPLGIPTVGEGDWRADPNGVTNGIAGLYLTPRELAKFGFLYLHRGQWDGKQVVPSQWVDDSSASQILVAQQDSYAANRHRDFGYLFSVFPDQKYYGYLGMAGQDLFIDPEQNLVAVFNSGLKIGEEGRLLKLMNDYILPSIQANGVTADAEKDQRLRKALEQFGGTSLPVQTVPAAALAASGKVFQFEENALGWKTAAFSFTPGADQARFEVNGLRLQVGLDNRYRLNEMPGSRPVGMRARWAQDGSLLIDDITLGEISEMSGVLVFNGAEITLTVQDKYNGGDALKLLGKVGAQ